MKSKLIMHSRNILLYIIYIIFLVFSIQQVVISDSISAKILYSLIAVVFLAVTLYSEYLRAFYQKCIRTLIIDVDTKKAEQQFQLLLKKDILHAYRNSKAIFDTLYYADEMDAENCLKTLEDNDRFFHGSLDHLLIFHYTKFYACFLQGNFEAVAKEYSHLQKMKDTKIKGRKISPLYNWEFIDALYQFSRKDYKKSLNTFNSIHSENMNNRERMHLYYQKGMLYMKMNNPAKAAECFKEAADNKGDSCMKRKAENYRKKVSS